jgi:hypothetical protein
LHQAKISPGANGLAAAAIPLVRQIAGLANAPSPAPAPAPAPTRAPSPARPRKGVHAVPVWQATLIAVGAVGTMVALGLLAVRYWRRRLPVTTRPLVDPRDPYRYTGRR